MEERLPHRIVTALLANAPENAERLARGCEAELAAWALQHRLGPVLCQMSHPEGRIRAALAEQHLVAVADELERESWVPSLLDAASAKAVVPIVFKGLGVAHDARLYASPALRPLGDLDLLVEPSDLDSAIAAAQGEGFVLSYPDPAVERFAREEGYQVALEHPRHGCLEIHHALYRDIPRRATTSMLARTACAQVYGRRLRRLDDTDLLYVLCVHLAKSKHLWVWSWLMDIALLGPLLSARQWRRLVEDSLDWGGQVFVVACLRTLKDLWAVEFPALERTQLERLELGLSGLERKAVRAFMRVLPSGPLGGEGLMLARRLSARPGRRSSPLRALWCHPGVVCTELGVRSDARGFTWHRVRHAGVRLRRGLRAITRL
jgi:hypothetical protein